MSGFQGRNVAQGRKPQSCGVCATKGHNRTSCPILSQNTIASQQQQDNSNAANNEDVDYDEEYGNIGTVEMVSGLVIVCIILFSYSGLEM
jgi:hypothetical protein